jgi:tetratricopeptide (TPR) repeat protein
MKGKVTSGSNEPYIRTALANTQRNVNCEIISNIDRATALPRRCPTLCICAALAAVLLSFASSQARAQSPEKPLSSNETALSSQADDPVLTEDRRLVESGRYAEAEKRIREYVSVHAASADAHFLLGYILYRENKPQDSLAEYTAAAGIRKPTASDLAVVATDYILLRDYADADKWLSQATGWAPENAQYWYLLGRTKYNENRFQEAVEAFLKSLALHPMELRAEYNLGLAYAGMGKNDDAISAYKTAISWEKQGMKPDPQPYLDLGTLLLEQGHADQSLPYLQQSAVLGSGNPRIHEELGQAYEQVHQLANAESEITKAIAIAPSVPSLHFELGRIEQKEGLTEKAKEQFARCAALNAAHSTDSAETPNPEQPE